VKALGHQPESNSQRRDDSAHATPPARAPVVVHRLSTRIDLIPGATRAGKLSGDNPGAASAEPAFTDRAGASRALAASMGGSFDLLMEPPNLSSASAQTPAPARDRLPLGLESLAAAERALAGMIGGSFELLREDAERARSPVVVFLLRNLPSENLPL
jgi:hypothetical protein